MTAILASIKSRHACNILNLIKLWEIRKKFPKDYVGWVYIYCTKNKPNLYRHYKGEFLHLKVTNKMCLWNGKVVARFWCDKVEEIKVERALNVPKYNTNLMSETKLCRSACLSIYDLDDYLKGKEGYAIHITNLEIFDKPKEISEFKHIKRVIGCENGYGFDRKELRPLTRAPESWCYVEV